MTKLDGNGTQEQKYEKVATSYNEKEHIKEKNEDKSYGYGVRHVQCFIIFMSLTVTFIARAHLSVTIVAMTDEPKLIVDNTDTNITAYELDVNTNGTLEILNVTNAKLKENKNSTLSESVLLCANGSYEKIIKNETDAVYLKNLIGNCTGVDEVRNISGILDINGTNENEGNSTEQDAINTWSAFKIYPWPKSVQEMVLGSFFLGYLIMMSPFGLIVQRWGGKLPLQISLFSSGAVSFFTPWLALWGDYKAVCATRVITGLMQAGTYPSLNMLIAKWVPLCERGRLATYIYTGSMVGAVLALHLSGFLVASPLAWPSVFWAVGILCLVMAILVTLFVSTTPQEHRTISEEEKIFILGENREVEKRQPTPWKAIMTSIPVWAAFATHVGTSTSYLFFFTQMPTYMHFIVGLNIKNSGLLSSLPYFANFLMSIGMGILTDYLTNNKIASLRHVRIISNTIANVGPSLCMFAVSFTTNATLAVALLVLCMATHAGTHTGWMVNYIDLSPNFSGALMATGNTLMNVSALLLPTLVSNIVIDVTNVHQWRIVLFVVASLALVCHTVFVFFMSADVQPWNNSSYQPTDLEDPDVKNDEKLKIQSKT